jgi:hypothetical protein
MIRKALFFVLILTSISVADWQTIEDDWFGLTISDAKSGWLHVTLEEDGNFYRSTSTQKMELSRAGVVMEIEVVHEFIETKDGKPVSAHSFQEAMGQVGESTWKFTDTEIEITSVAGGVPITKKIPMPKGVWMTPRVVDRHLKEQFANEVSTIVYQTLTPELGPKIITIVLTKDSEGECIVMGETQKVSTWKIESDAIPVTIIDSYNSAGRKVETMMNAGFGEMKNTLMSKQSAQSPVGEVPELMVTMFIEPSQKIPSDGTVRTIEMIAKSQDGTPVLFSSSGYQRATANADGSCTVVLDLDQPQVATEEEMSDPQFLSKTALCDGTDAAVVALAKEAVKNLPANASAFDRAEAMRQFVYRFITNKGYGNAFASASQVARDPSGDCTEHGVLLCGMLRASGIPSRGVMGVVYVSPDLANFGKANGVFGWHFWSQAIVDGKWLDFDATLQDQFSVGHIASTTSSLQSESVNADMAGIMAFIGNTDIEVVKIGN